MLPTNTPYLIAETAFHHQGDVDFLKELIDNAAKVGAEAIKFHMLLDLDDYFVKSHDAYSLLEPWLIPEKNWRDIIEYSRNKDLDVIVLCNDVASVRFIREFKPDTIRAIELHATGLNDYHLLLESAKFDGTIILGVGGSSLDEIDFAVELLRSKGNTDLFLMYGFQNYPTRYEDINLNKMIKLKQLFDLPVGYADHTDPNNINNEIISTLGVSMGINVCEKHFTHKPEEKRIDSQSAVTIDQLRRTRELMEIISVAVGKGDLKMSDGEKEYGNTGPMKKAIVASRRIKKGEVITKDHIRFKRTNESTYMLQNFMPRLIGLKANADIEKNSFIDFSNVEYEFRKADISQFKANQ